MKKECVEIPSQTQSELIRLVLEAKNAKTEEERKSIREKMFSAYYSGLNNVSEKGARKLTPVADKVASREGRIANNSDYDAYYQKYSETKKKVKAGTLGASIAVTAGVIPGAGVPVIAPIFAAGAKYSPDPNDAKMVDDAIASVKKVAASIFKSKKSKDVDVNGAIVAANTVKSAIKSGNVPEKRDIRFFDTVANKLNALSKKSIPIHVKESTYNLEDIKLLLEECIEDTDLDNAIDTISVVIEAYDFTNDDINDLFDIAETTINLRLT